MSKTQQGGAPRCPTCPDGICPSINTRPQSPQPAPERVAAAERKIADVLVEEFRAGERHEAVASSVVDLLCTEKYGAHLRACSEWAIHDFVKRKLLSAHAAQEFFRPSPSARTPLARNAKGLIRREQQPPVVIPYQYDEKPAAFNTFVVRAEQGLWLWWRLQENGISQREFAKELDISTRTLNTYARDAGITIVKRGQRPDPYSLDERKIVIRYIASNGSEAVRLRARDLLAEIERTSN